LNFGENSGHEERQREPSTHAEAVLAGASISFGKTDPWHSVWQVRFTSLSTLNAKSQFV
jgi:hypothetical protein